MSNQRYASRLNRLKHASAKSRRMEMKSDLNLCLNMQDFYGRKGKHGSIKDEYSYLRARGSDQASRRLTHRQRLNIIPKDKVIKPKRGSEHWKYKGLIVQQPPRDLDPDIETMLGYVTKSPIQFKWQYEYNGQWLDYLPDSSNRVEAAYRLFQKDQKEKFSHVTVRGSEWEYDVDFSGMKQRNTEHENHTERKIRRIKV